MFENLTLLNWIFLVSALLGGSLFIARVILMIIGMGDGEAPDAGHDFHVDIHADVHADMGADAVNDIGHDADGSADSSDSAFKIISLQGIMGFFLMFGTVGFTMHRIAGAGAVISVAGGSAAGFATMWFTARLLTALLRLQSDGTVDIRNAMGKEGTVYQRILPGGTGKVQIVVQNRLMEYEAMSQRNEELPTGTAVMAVYYKGNTLIVEKI